MTVWSFLLPMVLIGVSTPSAAEYRLVEWEGWTLHLEERFIEAEVDQMEQTLEEVKGRLIEIEEVVPSLTLEYIRDVPIWISYDSGSGACYHPSRTWLVNHGRNPDMARSIEIQRARDYLSWVDHQPMMVLHELAHALHHRRYQNQSAAITRAFENARTADLYENVEALERICRLGPR